MHWRSWLHPCPQCRTNPPNPQAETHAEYQPAHSTTSLKLAKLVHHTDCCPRQPQYNSTSHLAFEPAPHTLAPAPFTSRPKLQPLFGPPPNPLLPLFGPVLTSLRLPLLPLIGPSPPRHAPPFGSSRQQTAGSAASARTTSCRYRGPEWTAPAQRWPCLRQEGEEGARGTDGWIAG